MDPVDLSESEKLPVKASPLDMTSEICTSTTNPDAYEDVLAAPLVQIFSVCIHTTFDDGRPCEIYGSIWATDDQGNSFGLYDRDLSECETIQKFGNLSLTGPEGDAILGLTGVTIDLCLKDKTRDTELVKKQHYLNFVSDGIEDSYDKLRVVVLQSEYSSVYLYYTAFLFAFSAVVEVVIIKKDDDARGYFANVYGSLIASYSNSRQYCNSDNELKYLETVLFEKPLDQSVQVIGGTPIKLFRSVVAMPAYSSLVINVDLFDSEGQFARGHLEFPAFIYDECPKVIESENGCVQVNVTWKNVYRCIYKEREPKERELKGCTTVRGNTKDGESKTEEPSKKAQVVDLGLPRHNISSSFNLRGDMPQTQIAIGLKIRGGYLVEIFSVYIGGINREVSALCGTIKVYQGCFPFCIYDRGPNDFDVLLDDKIACIEEHFALRNPELDIVLDLNDPIQNLQVSRGEISWNSGTLHTSCSMSWFNKRICSVVQGADCYAALHYMVCDYAVIATVDVVFFCDNFTGESLNLYGILFAGYGGHEYSTDYEKKYYRSRLFDRPRNKPVPLSTGATVPLSKSVVAVPTESSLIIEADLKAIGFGSSDEEPVYGILEFTIDLSCTACKEIRVGFCRIEVFVKFENKNQF